MSQSLSIIVSGRNDNYGGQFTKNLQQFLLNTSALLPEAEIIVVEWNPPGDKPPLSTLWPEGVKGKIVTIPSEVHKEALNPLRLPLLEYQAKNAGIRRAEGDFILCMNPDTLISRRLAEEISEGLDSFTYYRTNRTDIKSLPSSPQALNFVEEWASEHNIVRHGKWGSYEGLHIQGYLLAILRRIRRYYKYRTLSVPHENGAGDFLLISRATWFEVGGYPELPLAAHVDAIMMCLVHKKHKMVRSLGKHVSHTYKGPLYHQDHFRKPILRNPWTDKVKADIMRGKHPISIKHGWGLAYTDLPCEVIS